MMMVMLRRSVEGSRHEVDDYYGGFIQYREKVGRCAQTIYGMSPEDFYFHQIRVAVYVVNTIKSGGGCCSLFASRIRRRRCKKCSK